MSAEAAGPATPSDSPLTMADVLGSCRYAELSTPDVAPGDLAPELDLPLLGGSGARVRLSAFRGRRPVALVFGSYT
jgi:hypothetical protein